VAEKPRKPTKATKRSTLGKVMASVFWDAHNLHRLPAEGKNSYGRVLCSVIGQTERRNKEKTAPYGGILYHDDNAPSHTSLKAMAKLNQLRFELIAHPPYSPDLAPSDYYLYPNLKR